MRLFLLLLLAATCLRAQSTYNLEVFGGLSLVTPQSSFTSIAGIPNPGGITFAPDGSTVAGHAGVAFDLPIVAQVRAGLRSGFQGAGATFTADESVLIAQPGGPYRATIQHTFTASLLLLNTEPYVRYQPNDWLGIDVGLPVMLPVIAEYSQTERFTDPPGLQFIDGSVEQTTGSGKIQSMRSPTVFASVRLSALLPINARREIFLTPQADFQQSLQSLVTSASVPVSLFRLGVGLRYMPSTVRSMARDTQYIRDTITVLSSRVKAPVTEIVSQTAEEFGMVADTMRVIVTQHYRTSLPKPPAVLRASLRIAFVGQGGKDVTEANVQVRNVRVTRHVPLLPVVVFTQMENGLPSRYVKLPRRDAARFTETQLRTSDPTHWQYQVLNVVGSRMVKNPQSTLTLRGVDDGSDMGNELIKGRIESIRTYLMSSFNIAPARLRVTIDHFERYQDWVIMTSDDETTTRPLVMVDTVMETTLPTVRLYPDVVNDVAIRAWSVILTRDSSTVRSFADTATAPRTLTWNMNDDLDADSTQNATLMATLSVFDVEGNVAFSTPSKIRVRAPLAPDPTVPLAEREEFLVVSTPSGELEEVPIPSATVASRLTDVWNGSPSVSSSSATVRQHGIADVPWFRKKLADPELYFWSSEARLYTKE